MHEAAKTLPPFSPAAFSQKISAALTLMSFLDAICTSYSVPHPSCVLTRLRAKNWAVLWKLGWSRCFHYLQWFLKALSQLLVSNHKQRLLLQAQLINKYRTLSANSLTNLFSTWNSNQAGSCKPRLAQKQHRGFRRALNKFVTWRGLQK